MTYEPIIGLEIHTELKTKTKMFCDCLNDPNEVQPNKNICPVCLAHPGTLPVVNLRAVEAIIKTGLSLNCEIAEFSKFDRKKYFYPDLPKGYQISQYDEPFCRGGSLPLFLSGDFRKPDGDYQSVEIMRIHLEEDTGRLIHDTLHQATLIDFNRAGVPLMELVTKPVITNALEARIFAQCLQLLLKKLEVADADMEKGQFRCEVNISLREKGAKNFGTKVEIKNLNSFKAIEKAIQYEIQRQTQLLQEGKPVIQETRGWDDLKECTYAQRLKEEASDYSYFPEPDIPIFHVYSKTSSGGLLDLTEIAKQMPELPWQTKKRLIADYQLSEVNTDILLDKPELLNFFKETMTIIEQHQELSKRNLSDRAKELAQNYLFTDILGLLEKLKISWSELKISTHNYADLMVYLAQDKISSRVAKDLLAETLISGQNPLELIKQQGLEKITDSSQLAILIAEAVENNPKAVSDYKKGKESAVQFLVGQLMAKLKGAADPKELTKLLTEYLANH